MGFTRKKRNREDDLLASECGNCRADAWHAIARSYTEIHNRMVSQMRVVLVATTIIVFLFSAASGICFRTMIDIKLSEQFNHIVAASLVKQSIRQLSEESI